MSLLSYPRAALAVLTFAIFAATAAAQTPAVIDPRIVEFDPSPDHTATDASGPVVTRYDLELYVLGGTQPVQVANLGKPAPQSDGKIRVDFTTLLSPWPAAGTVYEARVAAVGPAGVGRSTESNTFSFSSPCSSSISPTSVSVSGGASTGTVAVTGIAGCTWSATSAVSWITITAGAAGTGSGTVSYSVAANPTSSQRTGTLTISGHTFTVTQAGGCTYTTTPSATSVPAGATTGTASVTTTSGCAWTASSGVSWITITSGASGTGSGTVAYSVAANTSTSSRTGTLTVAGRTITITQDGAACTYVLSPVSATLGSSAATGTIAVTAGSGCAWTASDSASWITITSATSGSGNGQITYSVSANPGTSSRNGTITIGGETFTITQAGLACTFAIAPVSASVPADATTSTISVDTLAGCTWTASSSVSWITITSGASGSGDGTVTLSVAANPNLASRTGTVTVGGETFTVSQAGVTCTATIAPISASVGSAGAQGTVSVTLPSACSWTASSGTSWITITGGGTGTGSGQVSYSVAANTSTSSRTGTLTIAGKTFSVSQAGITCSYTVSPTTASAPATAGTGSVNVTSPAGCAWTASSTVSWMSITAGASSAGTGSASYSFTANPTTQARSGVLTVAGQAVTVTQAAGCGYSISPASASVAASSGSGTVTVTAGGGCAWTAQSPVSWVTFSTAASGTGNGSVGYVVAANPDNSSRSATITVAGQPFVITQAGAPCDATLNPTTQNIAAAGATTSVSVALPGGCTWSAVSSASWITILSGASGTGSGTVSYRVDPNPSGSTRSGTIAISGRLLTITQAATPCTATLSSTTVSVDASGGSRVVSVTIPPDCQWTAVSNASWITVTSGGGPNTSGSAAVTFNVAANTSTSSRTGTLTIAGQTFTVTQGGQTCSYTVAPTTASVSTSAGTGTVGVTTPAGCAWTASSSVSWMAITAGASGSGPGSVTYSFTANPTTQSRAGVLTVAGQAVTITQAAGCGYSISPASASISASAASGTVAVTAGAACPWTAQSPVSWITFSTTPSGTGSGSVGYLVAANPNSSSRSATITVAGEPFVVSQAGAACSTSLNPTTQNIGAAGGNSSVAVNVPGGCAWSAVPSASWIVVLTGASGSGAGTVTYRVDPNPAGVSRTGTLAIGGQSLTITQAAASCTATLSATSVSLDAAGGSRVVSVTIPSDCPWTAVSNASWITVTSGGGPNTSGAAAVTFHVAANTSTSPRTGTLTIAGQAFTVSQAGVTCSYTVSPTTASAPAAAGTGSVSVTSPAGCTWTASSAVSWMSITAGATGSGPGSVSYSFAANPTTQSRAGVLTVAGQAVTVTQAAGCGYSISPASASLTASAGSGTVNITAGSGCAWSAQSPASWVTFSTATSGTGTGAVGYVVAANPDSSSRSATITVAGQPFVITQAGAACDATLNPAAQAISAAGGNSSVAVAMPGGCAWSAVSSVSWITVLTGATGSGNGTITYSVDANPTGTGRTGTIAIGGRLHTVTQGAASCSATVSSTSESFEATGGSRVVAVTIPSGCLWTAVSNATWITVTSGGGPNTSGNGAVTFSVAANVSTNPRSGTLTIAGRTVTVDQAGTCDIAISPNAVSAGSDASSGSVSVTTGASCSWSTSASASWLTVTSGASGAGSGTVVYAMAANTGTAPRTATLTIGGRVFSVTQAAPTCSVVLSTTSVSLTAATAFRSVQVSTGATCAWTASSSVSWITIVSGASGTGLGSVAYSVAANTGTAARTGIVSIGGETVTVTQAGAACTSDLTPTGVSLSSAASNETVSVHTSQDCDWTASSNSSWLMIFSGSTGQGDGLVQYSVAPNTSPFARVGTMTIAGRTFTVSQAGNSCTAALSSSAVSVGAAASTVSVNVSAGSGCTWTATSAASWISVVGGANGIGPGTVSLAIAQHTNSAVRTGTVSIAGKSFTVTQSGTCDYSVSPTSVTVAGGSSFASIWVTSGSGCAWAAQSPVPWITLSTTSGSGTSLINVSVSANPTASTRTATLTIAGSAVQVTQAGAACNYLVSPVSLNVTGGSHTISVTAPAGCAWAATSTVPWMTFNGSASGTGDGSVVVQMQPNTGFTTRFGSINLAGWRIFVTQRVAPQPSPPGGLRIVPPGE
jgi:hypothetical protein